MKGSNCESRRQLLIRNFRRRQTEQNAIQERTLSELTHAFENMQAQTAYQSKVVCGYSNDREDYLEDVFREIRRASSSWVSPMVRSQLERQLREAVQSTLDSLPENENLTGSETGSELNSEADTPTSLLLHSVGHRPWKRVRVARANSTISTIFGQIHCSSKSYQLIHQGYGDPYDNAFSQHRKDSIVES